MKKFILIYVVGFLLIVGCANKEDQRFNEIPNSEKKIDDGFKNEDERKILKTYGFDEKDTLIKYQNSSIQEKIKISVNNFAKKTSGNFAIDCLVHISINQNYGKETGKATQEESNVYQIFINAFSMTVEDMVNNGRFTKDESLRKMKERSAVAFKEFDSSNDYKLSTFNKSAECIKIITPYFAQSEIDEYQLHPANPVNHLTTSPTQTTNEIIVAPAQISTPVPPIENSPFTPSFDCAKASNGQEKMICADRDLAKLDVEASQAYVKAREKSADKDALKKEQLNWIKFSLRACSDKACLTETYRKRISELQ